MNLVRPLLVFLVALSLALLPVAGGIANAASSEKAMQMSAPECCDAAKPCDKKPTNGCDSMAGCALKCFNFSGALVSGVVVRPVPAAAIEPVVTSLSVHPNPIAPPLPPPRV